MKIQLMAFAAHPDDAELSCSGVLKLHKNLGYTTGIIDLTAGELGSRGTRETRQQEASKAARILELDHRENVGFRDGFFKNDEEHQLRLIRVIRKYQPDIVLANAPSDRHPDHGRAADLVRDACFLSGLIRIQTMDDATLQMPWRPKRVFNYIQDQDLEPDFIIDISEVFESKMQSIRAYSTQFSTSDGDGPATYISSDAFVDSIRLRSRLWGKRIGVQYGEGYISRQHSLGLKDFQGIILPEQV